MNVNAESDPPPARRPELLAPAGGPEAGYAALAYGADAVYLGLARFSARAEAVNFTLDQVADLVGYAHAQPRRRRVYVTVNTLVLDRELGEAADALAAVSELGVDAAIVQDLGVYHIARRQVPALRLHASTQMAIHNREGVEWAREAGFARVTLARELTVAEAAELAALPGIEVECFIHGALCYGYSGLCLLSAHVAGRSGNRGRCAYLCRSAWASGGAGRFVFSMKDLALPAHVHALGRAGVAALKIEGRMKSPLYVAAAVKYYRRLLDGAAPDEAAACAGDLQTIFSRPWTDLYAQSRRARSVVDPERVGHRGRPAGRVAGCVRAPSGGWLLRFVTDRPLEVHDGLQVEVPGAPTPYGFAVDRLRVLDGGAPRGPVFTAPAGARVEVAVPAGAPRIPRGAVLYGASSQALKRKYRVEPPPPGRFRAPVPVAFEIRIGADGIRAAAETDGAPRAARAEAEASGPFPSSREAAAQRDAVARAFARLGATRFAAARLELHNEPARFVPVSVLNALRRRLLARLEEAWQEAGRARAASARADLATLFPRAPDAGPDPSGAAARWSLKTDDPAALGAFEPDDWRDLDELVIEVAGDEAPDRLLDRGRRLAQAAGPDRVRWALPVILRPWDRTRLEPGLRALLGAGWRRWQVSNPGAWRLLQDRAGGAALDVSADWPLYAVNRAAAWELLARGLTRLTLSPEDDLDNLRELLARLGERGVVIVYQDTPLMISETCVLDAPGCDGRGGCRAGERVLGLAGRPALRVLRRGCRMIVIRERPFCLAAHRAALARAGAVRLRADFLWGRAPPDRVREIWRRLRAGQPVPGGHDGNAVRGFL